MPKTLLSLGHGYSARALARRLLPDGWTIIGTTRSADKMAAISASGVEPLVWPGTDLRPAFQRATAVLVSAGPGPEGDPVLGKARPAITEAAKHLSWVGYLSTTGVYGDHGGEWVDETTPLTPSTERGRARVAAEADWQSIPGLPLHIFRLAGI